MTEYESAFQYEDMGNNYSGEFCEESIGNPAYHMITLPNDSDDCLYIPDTYINLPRNPPRLRRQYANTLCGRLGCFENCQHKDTDDELDDELDNELDNPEVCDESTTPENPNVFHKIVAHCDCDDCSYIVAHCDCDQCRYNVEHCDCEHCDKPVVYCSDCRQTTEICNCVNYIDPSDRIVAHCKCNDCTYLVAHCNCYQCKYNVENCDCDQCDKPIVYCIDCKQILTNCVCVENAAQICCGNLGCEDCRNAILCHNVDKNSNYENDNGNDNNIIQYNDNNNIQYNDNNIIHYTEIKNNINLNYSNIIDSKEDELDENFADDLSEIKDESDNYTIVEMKGAEPDGNLAEMKGDEPDGNNTFCLSVKRCANSEYELFESDHDDKFKYTGSLYSDCDSECDYCEDRKKYDRQ